MKNTKTVLHVLLIAGSMLCSLVTTAQCTKITVSGEGDVVTLQFDKNEKLIAITGLDEDEGSKSIKFITGPSGLPLPVKQKGVKWDDNGDGSFIITMNEGDEDADRNSMFKISKEGKIINWDLAGEESFKTTKYVYDKNGDLALMKWEGTMYDTKVTDKGELTATFNTAKPDVIMKGGPMLFLVTTRWLMLPMTNSHLITGFSYKQTIHVPERKIELDEKGPDKQPLFKIEPEKNLINNITRSFSYTWDEYGRIESVTVTGKGTNKKFKFTYSDCK
ncbi:MAG: hypothetical protein JST17_11485 [Bacteroidetes bacterium]|nr:hypothetical protein [Bacteroidota bacterium]MBS1930155.1 hypothetical protein [Bacteroidota bacterium]